MDNTKPQPIFIIGAGPAGMAAAIELTKAGRAHNTTVIERNDAVGGLAQTYTFTEGAHRFSTDNGPHSFFSKNRYLYDFIEDMLGDDWISVSRQTRQFIDGKFYYYPIVLTQALRSIGPVRSFKILRDYVRGRLRYGLGRKPIANFRDYIIAYFGETLGNFNMINYTEKIWGVPADTLHVDWARQRIKGVSIRATIMDTVRRAWGLRSNGPKSLVDTFFYPRYGTGAIYEAIRRRIEDQGVKLQLQSYPTKIQHANGHITVLTFATPQGTRTVRVNTLIESVPVRKFLELLDPVPPAAVLAAARALRYRSQVYLFITLDKEQVTGDQWVYFPEKHIPFGRISEMKNFSAAMSPKGKTSLFVEFFCFEGDEVWRASADELFMLALPHFEQLKFFSRDEVRRSYVMSRKNVYPIYDLAYQERLALVKNYLDSFANLYAIGRPGRFQYNNQDHSLEMGILAARSIIEGRRLDINAVGGEKEYFEQGYVPLRG